MPEPLSSREVASLDASMQRLSGAIDALRMEMAATYARKDVIEPRLSDIEKDIEKHGSYWDWLIKLIVGAVILALLGLVLAQGGGK